MLSPTRPSKIADDSFRNLFFTNAIISLILAAKGSVIDPDGTYRCIGLLVPPGHNTESLTVYAKTAHRLIPVVIHGGLTLTKVSIHYAASSSVSLLMHLYLLSVNPAYLSLLLLTHLLNHLNTYFTRNAYQPTPATYTSSAISLSHPPPLTPSSPPALNVCHSTTSSSSAPSPPPAAIL
jgi:hypothetical protein